VQLLPAFALPIPMLLGVPFSLAADLQIRAVHDKIYRTVRQAPGASADVYRSIPAGHGRMIWIGQI